MTDLEPDLHETLAKASLEQGAQVVPGPVGFRFTERMRGEFEPAGGGEKSAFGFVVTVAWERLDALLEDPALTARTFGTVVAPGVDDGPLTVVDGRFQLFVPERDGATLRMLHRMHLRSPGGKDYFLKGFKLLHDDPRPDLWRQSATLFFTFSQGAQPGGRVLGGGQVRVCVLDLLRQVTSLGDPRLTSLLVRRLRPGSTPDGVWR